MGLVQLLEKCLWPRSVVNSNLHMASRRLDADAVIDMLSDVDSDAEIADS